MEKILIGTILKPQGLNGEIKCKLENSDYSVIENVTEIYLQNKDVPTRIKSKAFRNGYLYIKIGTIDSREKADLLRGFNFYAERKFLNIPEDEYMIDDMIGLKVIDENGNEIGVLKDVENYGASDLLVIDQYKREYMVPFVDDIVVDVKVKQGFIVVNRKNYDEAKICE